MRHPPYNALMDDQQTYLLNGLLARQFDLGRIVRFRQVVRGRQAVTYELLTAEQHDAQVELLPAFDARDQAQQAVAEREASAAGLGHARPPR